MSMLAALSKQFEAIDSRSRELLAAVPEERLYQRPRETERDLTPFSCGEYILRSAAMVETAFNGITRRLWDDPFEWTLPERMSTQASVSEYLDDVARAREEGLGFFASDADLTRTLPAPEKLTALGDVLLEAIARAEHYLGRAVAIYQMLIDEKPPFR